MKYSRFNLFIEKDDKSYILFNTLSGHAFQVDKTTKEIVEANNVKDLDNDLRDKFKDCNILIEEELNENRMMTYFHNKEKFNNAGITSTVLLTWACNLKCVYCYEGAGEIRNTTMTKSTATKYIKYLKREATERNVRAISINLFGGEPLINFDMASYICEEMISFCEETGREFYSSIVTNGTLLTDEMLNKLKSYNCLMIQITLDGLKNIHDQRRIYKNGSGSFEQTINAIKLIAQKDNYINPVVRINVDKTNIEETYELLAYLKKEGLNKCHLDFGIVRSSTNACSSYADHCFVEAELGDVLQKLWVEAVKNGFTHKPRPIRKFSYCGLYSDSASTVAPNGDIYKCWENVGDEVHKVGILGEDGDLEDIRPSLYEWMTRNPVETKECSSCVYLPSCGGGCGVISYNETGTYHGKGCFKTRGILENDVKGFFENKEKEAEASV